MTQVGLVASIEVVRHTPPLTDPKNLTIKKMTIKKMTIKKMIE